MDLGNFLHLFQGSNKKLLEGKIAEIAATEEPVQGQYPDSPDAPGVMGGPVPTETPYDISRYPNSPDDPNRPRNFGYSPNPPVRTPSNVPYDISRYPNSPDDPTRQRNFGYSPNPPVRTPSNVPYDISQYPNSPDMAGVISAPATPSSADPNQIPVVPGTLQTEGSGVFAPRNTSAYISQMAPTAPTAQNLVPVNQYNPNDLNQVPITPNPNAQGLLQRAQLPLPMSTPEGIPTPPQSPQNEFDGMTVKPLTELQRAQQEATAARNQKVKKHAKWKDVLAYIVQGANAAFNPAPGQKIVGYGQVKKDNAIRAAEEKLQKVQGESMKNAQINATIQKPLTDQARLLAAIKRDEDARALRIQKMQDDDDFRKGKWIFRTDQDGYLYKSFPGDPTRPDEPVLNPRTGQQDFAPGEQMVDWIDPNTGQPIKARAKTIIPAQATLAATNARMEFDADKTNVSNDLDAQKANVTNAMKYNDQLNARIIDAAKNDAASQEAVGAMTGAYNALQGAAKAYDTVANNPYAEASEIQKAAEEVNKRQAEYDASVGKVKGAETIRASIEQGGLTRPVPIVPLKLKPRLIGEKRATRNDVEAFAKAKGISYEEAKRKAEADGYTVQ